MTSIQVQGIKKSFLVGQQLVPVLRGIDFSISQGQFAIIFGPSGSGKSTLLHTILGLEEPTAGTVTMLGRDIYAHLTEDARSEYRKEHVGMVYQQSHWVKSVNVLTNVSLPLLLLGEDTENRLKKAMQTLEMFKMQAWAYHHPSELSSGQQQKVSLARALITDPEIIIADEPTGNLDFDSGQELMKMLKNLSKTLGKTVLMVTHDLSYLQYADISLKVIDGMLAKDTRKTKPAQKDIEN
ncbi:MAG: ABC transporter ATP-binding protein [Pseudomonadales bacterium]|nr:ABC transporter ATP-binding protein [Candidatus Woesebacteria bacterium]MCB9801023.1 ABC transporter ATP-binding protein [Pseudomonadales bacterium]